MSAATTEKTPSIFWVYFFGVFTALLGAFLGFAYLASFSAQAFSSEAEYTASLEKTEEPSPASKPGDAYYIKGGILASGSWEPKRAQLATPGPQSVSLRAEEINAWMAARFRSASPSGEGGGEGIMIVPGVPNVAFTDEGVMYLNVPAEISAYGARGDFMITAQCSVSEGGLEFHTVRVRSADVPLPNLLGAKLMDVLSQGYQSTEDYQIISDAFARADSIMLEENSLVVQLP